MWITIQRDSQLTLTRQIYDKIKKMILDGTLASRQRLPSTHTLSRELGVSRNIVLDVYNQLIAEGYLEAHHGSGTIVSEGLQALENPVCQTHEGQKSSEYKEDNPKIDFRSGVPALELFPHKEWGRLYQEICNSLPAAGYGYCGASGIWDLREEIAHYLFRTRGISCSPKRIIITSGSTQGLSLISNLLQRADKKVLIEDPSHPGLRKVITSAGCKVEGVSVDNRGLDTDLLESTGDVSFIYTTPSHQYPLGGIFPWTDEQNMVKMKALADLLEKGLSAKKGSFSFMYGGKQFNSF